MERRLFLKLISGSLPLMACGCSHSFYKKILPINETEESSPFLEDMSASNPAQNLKNQVGSIVDKSENFDADYVDDVFCPHEKLAILEGLVRKFRAVERYVGNGNFNLVSMPEFITYSARVPGISAVNKLELKFLEELYYYDAKKYGFFGSKVFHSFEHTIDRKSVYKVPFTGHYLNRGTSLETYNKIRKDVGDSLILTSGIRGLAKQYHLFLEKTLLSVGNYSRASRSIAPPGYSFHGEGDFDIGKIGMGLQNFTDEFAKTREFQALTQLGYIDIRYKEANHLGVRFEPWHIKI